MTRAFVIMHLSARVGTKDEPIEQMRFKLAILAHVRNKQTHAKVGLAAACDTLVPLGVVPNISARSRCWARLHGTPLDLTAIAGKSGAVESLLQNALYRAEEIDSQEQMADHISLLLPPRRAAHFDHSREAGGMLTRAANAS